MEPIDSHAQGIVVPVEKFHFAQDVLVTPLRQGTGGLFWRRHRKNHPSEHEAHVILLAAVGIDASLQLSACSGTTLFCDNNCLLISPRAGNRTGIHCIRKRFTRGA